MRYIIVGLLRAYQYVSRYFSSMVLLAPLGGCRYAQTCSEYAIEQVTSRGVVVGGYSSVVRIISCNSFHVS